MLVQVPYQTNKAALVEKIAELVEGKVIQIKLQQLIGLNKHFFH